MTTGDKGQPAVREDGPRTEGQTADQEAAAWDGRGIANTANGPMTTEEW
ncbi:hypothetical protein [Streptomyces cinereoruber]